MINSSNYNPGIISFGRLTVCPCSLLYTSLPHSGKVHLQGTKGAFEKSAIKGGEFGMLKEDEEDRASLCFMLHPTGAQ